MVWSLKKYSKLSSPIKASIWFTVATFLQRGLSILTTPIFTRLLDTNQYGLYNVYNSWLAIISIFATLRLSYAGFNSGMIKFENDKDKFTSSMQGLSTTTTLILMIIYLLFNDFWNEILNLPTFIVMMMFFQIFVSPALDFWASRQRFKYKYHKLVLITLLMSILNPLVSIIAINMSEDPGLARIISVASIQIVICTILYIYNFKKGKLFFSKEYWRFGLSFNLPLIPHYLSETILNQADRIMINNFYGAGKAGIYSVAYSAGMLINIFSVSINSSLIPWTYKNLKLKKYDKIKSVSNFILLIVGGLAIILIAFAPEIIKILAPPSYYEAIWIIPPIAASVYFIFLYNLFSNVEFYFEESKFIMYASISGAVLNILLNYLFIPIIGYVVAAYTTLICYILYSITHYIFMKLILKKNKVKNDIYNLKFIVILSLIILFLSFLIMSLYNYIIVRYTIIIIFMMAAFLKRNLIIENFKKIK